MFPCKYSNAKYLSLMDHSHSDNNLVELGSETIKEDDRAILLEGGLTKSASAKFNSSSIKVNLIRLLLDNKSITVGF